MLQIQNVFKFYDDVIAVNDFSIEIPEGRICGLLGPNGAGKTTLLRMITGLLKQDKGRITLFDKYTPMDKDVRKLIGYMPQDLAVYPGLSVRENIHFFGQLYHIQGKELRKYTQEVIELVELVDKQDVVAAHLSGGMTRRLLLATSLVHKPRLLILDEPTSGVDPVLRIKFWQWLKRLVGQGTSILVTTHHIAEAKHCNEVFFLREGHLLDRGAPDELMRRYGADDLEAAFVNATNNHP